jgi:5-methylthioadenosine/S-adenosylhomocysteine deaminase
MGVALWCHRAAPATREEQDMTRETVDRIVAGGHVLTMDVNQPAFPDGAVAIRDGRIAAVGSRAGIEARFDAAERIDARGCVVLPGLVDAYAHAGHGMIRGLFHPAVGWPAGPLYWHATTPGWWRAEARLAALERLRGGVTTGLSVIGATPARADDTVFSDVNAEAYLEAGLGFVLAVGPPDPVFPHLSEPFEGSFPVDGRWERRGFTHADAVRVSLAVIDRWNGAGGGRIRVALAPPYLLGRHVQHRRTPHRLPDASDVPAMLAHARQMREIADDRGVILQTHMFAGSVDFARAHFGDRELDRILGPDVLACHSNGLGPEEVRVLGAHRCGIGTVAFTHENLWYGMAPIPALIEAGCAVAATSDGAAPYTSLDLWREMARTAWNQWSAAGTQSVLPPETLLRMVTIDAARALSMDDRIGSLAPGKDADVVLMDLNTAHVGPIADLASSLVFFAAAADVRTVIAKGEVLLRDRRPVRVDADAIIAEAREAAAQALAHVDLTPWRRSVHWDGRARGD